MVNTRFTSPATNTFRAGSKNQITQLPPASQEDAELQALLATVQRNRKMLTPLIPYGLSPAAKLLVIRVDFRLNLLSANCRARAENEIPIFFGGIFSAL